MAITLGELAERFDCELIGDPSINISAVGSLRNAGAGELSFLADAKLRPQLATTSAAAVICRAEDADGAPGAVLVHENPYACYARIAAELYPAQQFESGVHATAVIAATANVDPSAHVAANAVIEDGTQIGARCYVGPGVVVGPDCKIGNDCRLMANVTFVRAVRTGERCIFHSGSVLGSDGFGNVATPDGWIKVTQVGGVRVGNDVEIGASTTVDCGAIDDTIIGDGVRIDNQVQVAHNVEIGEHTALAAGAAIAGSTKIGRNCLFAGMVGASGHLNICDGVTVLGKAMIAKDIREPGVYASMLHAEDARSFNKRQATFRRIDKLSARVSALEKSSK